jgi:PAS domain S-box-containing protein
MPIAGIPFGQEGGMGHTLESLSRQELEKRLHDYEQLMNVSEVCIVKIRLADFTIEEYNDAMCQMIGYSRAEYEEKFHHNMQKYFAGEYRLELEKLQQAALRAITKKKASFAIHIRVPTKHGAVWVGGVASFVEHKNSQPVAMMAVYRDISDVIEAQKKLELAEIEKRKAAMLETQNRKLYRMIDCVPSGLGALYIINGVPERMMQLNRYFTERVDLLVAGDRSVDLYAFLNCIHPGDRERCSQDFHNFLTTKEQVSRQYRFRNMSGEYFWGSVRGIISSVTNDIEIAYFIYTNIEDMKNAERKLQESRAVYENTIDALQVGMWTYDIAKHRIVLANNRATEALRKRFGWPHVFENAPESTLEFIEEEDHDKYLAVFHKIDAGLDAACDVWYRSQDGIEPHCARESYYTVCDETGKPILAYGIGQNVTAEKKVEERYEREIGYLRQADDNNLVAKGHYNLTKNVVLEYSTKNDSIFKVAVGMSYDEAFQSFTTMPLHVKECQEIADKLEREKLIQRYQHGEMQTSLTYCRGRDKDVPIWITMNIHTYMMPETGDLECFTYSYDVSHKLINDSIMSIIANEAFDYIGLIFTESEEFEFIKKSADITFPDVHQKTPYRTCCEYVCNNFVSEAEQDLHRQAVSIENIVGALRQGNGHHVVTYLRQEGDRVFCKQLNHVWLDQTAGIILVVRSDITAGYERDQRQIAQIEAAKLEADRANEAKSAFLSSMSHDLRTPLNGVIGFTGLALQEADLQKKQEYLHKIDLSGKLLLDLINDTLELSRIESGKMSPEPEAVMPNSLLPIVVTALRPTAELNHVRLIDKLPKELTAPIWCDRLKVQKIALNLISNAIKYTPAGGTVTVSLKPLPTHIPNCPYSLVVKDTGIGMSEDFLRHLYEPFSQEKRSETSKVVGTGLGLAIVKRYVDLLGGAISVESQLHKGTCFVVSLPIQEVKEGQALQQRTLETEKSLAGIRVLLCEDNELNAEIAVMLLKNKKILAETAENGKEGLAKFISSKAGYYDAILMDIRMPVMDGYEATKAIRALERSDAKTVPVIAMTADAFDESIREAKVAGMDDYVTKPVEPEKLYQTLAQHLQY